VRYSLFIFHWHATAAGAVGVTGDVGGTGGSCGVCDTSVETAIFLFLFCVVAMAHRPLVFTKGPLRLTHLVNLW